MSKNHAVNDDALKPTDLRGILKYVPMFRDHVFVVALDGGLVGHGNFQNVLLDIAVLRSLNIKVILTHGIDEPFRENPIDADTLARAKVTSLDASERIMRGLTRNGLRCAHCNGVRSREIGIVQGKDRLFAGTVDKIDLAFFNRLLEGNIVPIVAPIASDREDRTLLLNPDPLAAELAAQLKASKLIYMTTEKGIRVGGKPLTNMRASQWEALSTKCGAELSEPLQGKMRHAIEAIHAGTPRAHILDGRLSGALLNEIFDKVGIGTMIYADEYDSIRPAVKADAVAIYNITRDGVRSRTLRERTQERIEADIDHYLVYEIDGGIVGCVHQRGYGGGIIEIGNVYVRPFYQGKGIGKGMVDRVSELAEENGARRLFAMTTQAADFFERVCRFEQGDLKDLPPERREEYLADDRNSKIFYRDL